MKKLIAGAPPLVVVAALWNSTIGEAAAREVQLSIACKVPIDIRHGKATPGGGGVSAVVQDLDRACESGNCSVGDTFRTRDLDKAAAAATDAARRAVARAVAVADRSPAMRRAAVAALVEYARGCDRKAQAEALLAEVEAELDAIDSEETAGDCVATCVPAEVTTWGVWSGERAEDAVDCMAECPRHDGVAGALRRRLAVGTYVGKAGLGTAEARRLLEEARAKLAR